jgi:hypothetical protein
MRSDNVYLEEDCDLSAYVKALLKREGIDEDGPDYEPFMREFWRKCDNHDTSISGKGRIRGYARYQYMDRSEQLLVMNMRSKLLQFRNWDTQGANKIRWGSKDDLEFWMKHYNIKL